MKRFYIWNDKYSEDKFHRYHTNESYVVLSSVLKNVFPFQQIGLHIDWKSGVEFVLEKNAFASFEVSPTFNSTKFTNVEDCLWISCSWTPATPAHASPHTTWTDSMQHKINHPKVDAAPQCVHLIVILNYVSFILWNYAWLWGRCG